MKTIALSIASLLLGMVVGLLTRMASTSGPIVWLILTGCVVGVSHALPFRVALGFVLISSLASVVFLICRDWEEQKQEELSHRYRDGPLTRRG